MSVGWIAALMVGCGAAGGFVNALLASELHLPHRHGDLYSPGWIGNVVIGAVASIVYWGLYGPMARTPILGGTVSWPTLSELAGVIVTGIAGSRILSNEVEKKAISRARDILADSSK